MTRRSSSSASRRPECVPRYATPRNVERETFGPQIAAVSKRLGQPSMPWQQLVADVGGELMVLPNGRVVPAYREVIVTVPRQSGKTTVVLSWMIQRAHGWGSPQRMAYTAQTGNDARKKLVEDWVPLLRPRLAKLGIRRIFQGMGNEGID